MIAPNPGLAALPSENPFSEALWGTPSELPPFERIRPEHYLPAFEAALSAHNAEIAAITQEAAPPTFANTIAAMERAGLALDRVAGVFYNLTGSHTNPELQAIERTIGPKLSRHGSAIYLDPDLWARISAVDADAERLGDEESRVLSRYRTRFRRSGADLGPEDKLRVAEIAARMSELGTRFSQNLLADESSFLLPLDGPDDLAGLPDFLVAATADAAKERGGAYHHVVTLSRSLIEPFLVCSTRRDLRERAYDAWIHRGEGGGATDNRGIIAEIVKLRAERARLLGFESFAHFKLDDTMAATPEAAMSLLREVWTPALKRAGSERARLQAIVQAEGGNFALQAHDWRHYAEKLRRVEHDLDESEIKAYLPLDSVINAAFDTATRLFGLTFAALEDVPRYHPDLRAWQVSNADGSEVGTFLGDYFARPSKRSGAWMSAFRSQEKLTGDVKPIIVNVMNFAKAPVGEASLLSFDDARTLFHEFGHALHGLLSDVTYPLLAGTAVSGDFVELPSQLYEHWLEQPEVLRTHARHHRTGEAMPEALLDEIARRPHVQPGVLHGGVHRLGDRRHDAASLRGGRGGARCRAPSSPMPSRASRCRPRSTCGTARRTSRISSRATAMRRATTAISGPRCWTRMRSTPSAKPATSSIRRPRRACAPMSTGRGTCAIRGRPTPRSAAVCRAPSRCCASAGWPRDAPARSPVTLR